MTSDKIRYFQSKVDGGVTTGGYLEGNPNYAEVQVVPLDAIVVNGVLPKVKVREAGFATDGKGIVTVPTDGSVRPEALVENALAYLALAKYLREHPPVDAGQVMALADALEAEWFPDDPDRATVLARRLVVRGVRVEVA